MIRVVAPGKLVLAGEYAVLDGAPAVVLAVDRGVRCDAHPSSTLTWDTPGDDRFVRAALHDAPPARYAFTDDHPAGTATKAGFGGSAAATVAAVAAAWTVAGRTLDLTELHARAFAVHRGVQGSGSGVDVAASVWGGCLELRGGAVRPLPVVHPVVVWSGTSARTGPRVARYLAWSGREDFVSASTEVVEAFADDPVAALRASRALLADMAERAGVAWATPALDAITALAEHHGGAAKPSGAGGGDSAVALFPTSRESEAFAAAIVSAGYTVIPVQPAALRVEESS